jgi:hypothetical protein
MRGHEFAATKARIEDRSIVNGWIRHAAELVLITLRRSSDQHPPFPITMDQEAHAPVCVPALPRRRASSPSCAALDQEAHVSIMSLAQPGSTSKCEDRGWALLTGKG